MTVLSVVKDVCANVGVTIPTSIFSGISANRTMQEMLTLANEMAQRISYDTRDWKALQDFFEMPGDGSKTEFTLPNNFKRMTLTASLWRASTPGVPLTYITDADVWLQHRMQGRHDGSGEWLYIQNKIVMHPALAAGDVARFVFVDKNCVALANGGFGDQFITDGDRFRLDERLLKLGMIWQWKASKGSPYAEDMGTYGDALANAMGHDNPSPIIVGRTRYAR